MLDIRSPVFTYTFLGLIALATLFPPFIWGEEQLRTEADRRIARSRYPTMYSQLPMKKYAFLLGGSTREILEWSWDGQQSIQVPRVLHRRLLVPELLLEYVLCLVLSVIVAPMISRGWARGSRGAA